MSQWIKMLFIKSWVRKLRGYKTSSYETFKAERSLKNALIALDGFKSDLQFFKQTTSGQVDLFTVISVESGTGKHLPGHMILCVGSNIQLLSPGQYGDLVHVTTQMYVDIRKAVSNAKQCEKYQLCDNCFSEYLTEEFGGCGECLSC